MIYCHYVTLLEIRNTKTCNNQFCECLKYACTQTILRLFSPNYLNISGDKSTEPLLMNNSCHTNRYFRSVQFWRLSTTPELRLFSRWISQISLLALGESLPYSAGRRDNKAKSLQEVIARKIRMKDVAMAQIQKGASFPGKIFRHFFTSIFKGF